MAAKTPAELIKGASGLAAGAARSCYARFTDIDDADTWATPFNVVKAAWAQTRDATPQAVNCQISGRTVTFQTANSNLAVDVYAIGT